MVGTTPGGFQKCRGDAYLSNVVKATGRLGRSLTLESLLIPLSGLDASTDGLAAVSLNVLGHPSGHPPVRFIMLKPQTALFLL